MGLALNLIRIGTQKQGVEGARDLEREWLVKAPCQFPPLALRYPAAPQTQRSLPGTQELYC
jgi:hypothetical protein